MNNLTQKPKYFNYYMLTGIVVVLIVHFLLKLQYGMNFLVLFIFLTAIVREDGFIFIKDWWKYVLFFYLYEISRAEAYNLGTQVLNSKLYIKEVLDIEKSVFFFLDDIPNVLLQRYLYPILSKPDWYDYIFFLFYAVFFFIWAVTAYVLWTKKRNLFHQYFNGLLALSFFSIFIFFIAPTAPPWYASKVGLINPPVERVIWSFEYLPGLDISSINQMGQNEFAALPSLHTAWAMYAALFWIKAFRRKSLIMLIFPAGIALATWYGAEHYVIDSVVGAGLAILFFLLATNWNKIKQKYLFLDKIKIIR